MELTERDFKVFLNDLASKQDREREFTILTGFRGIHNLQIMQSRDSLSTIMNKNSYSKEELELVNSLYNSDDLDNHKILREILKTLNENI